MCQSSESISFKFPWKLFFTKIDDLFDKKVLLLHAGGQSKRMPSATILGKIFSAIPMGNPLYQMLDFKLAMYWPFIPRMPPGIFVACSIFPLKCFFRKLLDKDTTS
jgi:hypothetical protein